MSSFFKSNFNILSSVKMWLVDDKDFECLKQIAGNEFSKERLQKLRKIIDVSLLIDFEISTKFKTYINQCSSNSRKAKLSVPMSIKSITCFHLRPTSTNLLNNYALRCGELAKIPKTKFEIPKNQNVEKLVLPCCIESIKRKKTN